MKKILLPHDLSNIADNALEYATQFANKSSFDSITVLHVIPEYERKSPFYDFGATAATRDARFSTPSGKGGYSPSYVPTDERVSRHAVNTALEHSLLESTNSADEDHLLRKKAIAFNQNTLSELLEEAVDEKIDLVIMGTSGTAPQGQESLTADFMLRYEQPMLVIPPKAVFRGLNKIVHLTDHRSFNKSSLRFVETLAQAQNSELILANIQKENQLNAQQYACYQQEINELNRYEKMSMEFIDDDAPLLDAILNYIEQHDIDLLSIVSRKGKFEHPDCHFSLGLQLCYAIDIPLLIFHE